ncbi:GNAT family N-acetyltransferase [Chitinophaga rhizosphaerae]|uniref:GNAT family N-acetyltransferase n=1 Tax=Chitinophaga rhizosphaerae TaxID=1864947 RepID=UPI000F811612|nr:GNAT family N-acetyltransferase [Chitinophaga rhizosphaerae]
MIDFQEFGGSQRTFITERQIIEQLWSALKLPIRTSRQRPVLNLIAKLFRDGWMLSADLEDLIYALDPRLEEINLDVSKLIAALRFSWEKVCFRPRSIATGVIEYNALRPEPIAAVLILLEQFGLQTPAYELVNKLLPSLKPRRRKILTVEELDILWYPRFRGRNSPVALGSENYDGDWIRMREDESLSTPAGYKARLYRHKTDDSMLLDVSAPRPRKLMQTKKMICTECGLEWLKGDPESSLLHRREHKKRLIYLRPLPLSEMIAEMSINENSELVTSASPMWKHEQMHLRAVAFRREMHFDFPQWVSPENKAAVAKTKAHGYLFTNNEQVIVGACSFQPGARLAEPDRWALDWVWIAPVYRGKGILDDRWDKFKQQYGNFWVSHPVSEAMQSFLNRHGDLDMMK